MDIKTGYTKPGVPSFDRKPHLGDLLLERYGDRILSGFEDLKKFELVDQLKKPVLNYIFYGNRKKILEVEHFLLQFPYAFTIRTKEGFDLYHLPEKGVRNAYVHVSRFPKLIKFIIRYETEIPNDLWGILYGYPLAEVHQFTYDWEAWAKRKRNTKNEE